MDNKLEPEPEPARQQPETKIIGLTGGIGSGKTTVAKIIEKNGFPVYSSDSRAKDLVNEDPELKTKITELLGKEAYDENGQYNRKYVAGKVFENAGLLTSLNETIHPAVKKDFLAWIKTQNREIVFKETALLFELHLEKECFRTLLVTADDNLRMKRVMDRDKKTYRQVEAIMDNQMPEKDKIRKADYVICNNATIGHLQTETEEILRKITEEAAKSENQ